jgi:hypothetical protein
LQADSFACFDDFSVNYMLEHINAAAEGQTYLLAFGKAHGVICCLTIALAKKYDFACFGDGVSK